MRNIRNKIVLLLPILFVLSAIGLQNYSGRNSLMETVNEATAAQVDYFLKIEGIEGESTIQGHEGEIIIQEFSWGKDGAGVEQLISNLSRSVRSGKPEFSEIQLVKKMDKSSPKLFEAVTDGKSIPEVALVGLRAGEQQQQFLVIKLSEVYVTSYQTSGSGNDLPTDNFSLNYSKIEYEYYPQKEDGTLDSPVKAGWNLKKNEKV